jgi:peptidoglycan/xylan/chitin deacetylase (PgdA/CDA1 family)
MVGIAVGSSLAAVGAVGAAISGLIPLTTASAVSWSALAAVGGGVVLGSTNPGWQFFGPALTRGSGRQPWVALTFDDGPDPASTPALLDALDQAGAQATFFLLVDKAEQYPQLTRDIAASHEIGLHGLAHHPWLSIWSPKRGAAELREAMDRLGALTGKTPYWYRPPFGVTSPRLAQAVERVGLKTAWCSLRTMDGIMGTPASLRARCMSASPGEIVLLHEGPDRPAPDALPAVLRDLSIRGLKAVTLSHLTDAD